jgi:hypothetical protein
VSLTTFFCIYLMSNQYDTESLKYVQKRPKVQDYIIAQLLGSLVQKSQNLRVITIRISAKLMLDFVLKFKYRTSISCWK